MAAFVSGAGVGEEVTVGDKVGCGGGMDVVAGNALGRTSPMGAATHAVSSSNSKSHAEKRAVDNMNLGVAVNSQLKETMTVFTDDHAPIEWIVNDMVIRFILDGGTEYLQ